MYSFKCKNKQTDKQNNISNIQTNNPIVISFVNVPSNIETTMWTFYDSFFFLSIFSSEGIFYISYSSISILALVFYTVREHRCTLEQNSYWHTHPLWPYLPCKLVSCNEHVFAWKPVPNLHFTNRDELQNDLSETWLFSSDGEKREN